MKLLITGGAGFLGYHLATYFKNKCEQLTLLDLAPFPKTEYSGNFNLVQCDIRDRKKLSEAIKGHTHVIHAAAALPLWSKNDILSTNIQGTKNVLDASRKHRIKRVVYISSTAVYGVPKKHPVFEKDPLVGVGPYGISKIAAEEHCRKAIQKGLNVTIIRPKTFVGTGRLGVFEILFDWIHDGKKIPVVGSGNNRYQLLEVDDLVAAIAKTLESRSKKLNDAFNVGAEHFQTVRKDLEEVFAYAKSGSSIFPTPAWPIKKTLWMLEQLNLSPLYQWVYETADKDSFVSIEKIKKATDWKPKHSNAEALIKAYQWYLDHYTEVKSRKAGITHTAGWKQGALGIVKRFM